MHFARLSAILLALLVLFSLPAAAEEDAPPAFPPLPVLTDPLDMKMQQLAVIYQKDPRFDALRYDTERFSVRGCAPSSVANAIIAAFDVTDPAQVEGIVPQLLRALGPSGAYKRRPIDQTRLKNVLNPQQMAESAERYPDLATAITSYPGTIDFSLEDFTLDTAQAAIEGHAGKDYMTTGRISVRDSWEEAVRILYALHSAGEDDAILILSYAGAGTASGAAPLRTSSSGHYLTLYIHTGTFIESGRIYVLDSLPRALPGEDYANGAAYRSCYAFVKEDPDSAFNAAFTASRISPVVIRTDLNESACAQLAAAREQAYPSEEERREALIALHTQLMKPYIIYSTCTAILRLNQN